MASAYGHTFELLRGFEGPMAAMPPGIDALRLAIVLLCNAQRHRLDLLGLHIQQSTTSVKGACRLRSL